MEFFWSLRSSTPWVNGWFLVSGMKRNTAAPKRRNPPKMAGGNPRFVSPPRSTINGDNKVPNCKNGRRQSGPHWPMDISLCLATYLRQQRSRRWCHPPCRSFQWARILNSSRPWRILPPCTCWGERNWMWSRLGRRSAKSLLSTRVTRPKTGMRYRTRHLGHKMNTGLWFVSSGGSSDQWIFSDMGLNRFGPS